MRIENGPNEIDSFLGHNAREREECARRRHLSSRRIRIEGRRSAQKKKRSNAIQFEVICHCLSILSSRSKIRARSRLVSSIPLAGKVPWDLLLSTGKKPRRLLFANVSKFALQNRLHFHGESKEKKETRRESDEDGE